MRKFITYQSTGKALNIKSVISPAYGKGFIYIEAYKQQYVKHAIEGVTSLQSGMWTQKVSWITQPCRHNLHL